MKKVLLAAAATLAISPAFAQGDIAEHRVAARQLAERSGYMTTFRLQCRGPDGTEPNFGPGVPPATRIFDNLYYVGLNSVGAYAVKTSAGIILIDSLNTGQDAETVIVPGLKALGLDPRDIKYVIVSHAHGDHYGGAQWLHDTYGARVVASAADWDGMEHPRPMGPPPGTAPGAPPRPAPRFAPPPKRDMVASDGQKLTLGDTTITMVVTPGHTPGTLSFLVPVTDKGKPHMLAMWGGTGIPGSAAARADYVASVDHFATFTKPAHADVELSNHPFVDDSLTRMEALRANPNGPNPFVIGEARYADYTGILKECVLAQPPAPAGRP